MAGHPSYPAHVRIAADWYPTAAKGGVLFVRGTPHAGKSACLRTVAATLRSHGVNVIAGGFRDGSYVHDAGSSTTIVAASLAVAGVSLLELPIPHPGTRSLVQIAGKVAIAAGAELELVDRVRTARRIEFSASVDMLCATLRRRARKHPVLWLVDDLDEAATAAPAQVIDQLAGEIAGGLPLFVVAALRPATTDEPPLTARIVDRLVDRGLASVVDLEPLDPVEIEAWTGRMFADVLADIAAVTGGSPGLVAALWHGLVEREVVMPDPETGFWCYSGERVTDPFDLIRSTLRTQVDERIWPLMELAAVLTVDGGCVDVLAEPLADAAGLSAEETMDLLDAALVDVARPVLAEQGFLGPYFAYRFVSRVTAVAVADGLDPASRARLAGVLAVALEHRTGTEPTAYARTAARLYHAAGLPGPAAAADQRADYYLTPEDLLVNIAIANSSLHAPQPPWRFTVEEMVRSAVVIADRVPAEELAEVLHGLLDLAVRTGARRSVLQLLALAADYHPDPDDRAWAAREGLECSDGYPDVTAWFLLRVAHWAMPTHEFDQARKWLQRAADIAKAIEDDGLRAESEFRLADVLAVLEDHGEAVAALARGRAARERVHALPGYLAFIEASVLWRLGPEFVTECQDAAERAVSHARATYNGQEREAMALLAIMKAQQGDLSAFDDLTALSSLPGDPAGFETLAYLRIGALLRDLGQREAAMWLTAVGGLLEHVGIYTECTGHGDLIGDLQALGAIADAADVGAFLGRIAAAREAGGWPAILVRVRELIEAARAGTA